MTPVGINGKYQELVNLPFGATRPVNDPSIGEKRQVAGATLCLARRSRS
jgi:hypothetical protein